ncbi:MAG: 3-hydroxy-3-methylglutaryl coenzyme A reductase [Candidatus Nitrosocaldaceae archaeon]|nr:MAG: 3-hydroxy-3-methylglutaryl coenzyme A reductase [Candidatus Nitrosocaldaceae archaeon]
MKFYEMSIEERLKFLKDRCNLTDEDINAIKYGGLTLDIADHMVENAIGILSFPLGIATNFLINGKEYLIPMSIEEPSVIAASSKAAKLAKKLGGFRAEADEPYMIGQIQVLELDDPLSAATNVLKIKDDILALANSKSRTLQRLNAGAKDLTYKIIDSMLIIELLIDVRDAMGANIINTMCEAVSPLIEEATKGRVLLKILSNYSTRRMVRSRAKFDLDDKIIDDIINAYRFATLDKYRAVTHNKGIMNGIIAVANALMQDTRAIEAAAHAYACRNGYNSLTRWYKDGNHLVGEIELPLAVGTVGGAINIHPTVRACMKILDLKDSKELACIMASVGLAQNFAALLALSTTGIQKGHMKMHARNIAMAAGATGDLIDIIAKKIYEENNITIARAKELLDEYS